MVVLDGFDIVDAQVVLQPSVIALLQVVLREV